MNQTYGPSTQEIVNADVYVIQKPWIGWIQNIFKPRY